jgi:hypothetical protein
MEILTVWFMSEWKRNKIRKKERRDSSHTIEIEQNKSIPLLREK